MRRTLAFLPLSLLLLGLSMAQADHLDGSLPVHEVAGGSYVAHEPVGWDGASPLAVVVFFHGYGQQGTTVMRNAGLTGAFGRHGVLVVAPNGQEKRWGHQGAPSRQRLRDDETFIEAVLADVRRRWPIDARRVWASGFSIGGSMTWHMACFRADLFTAFLPVAGAFWRPHPEACPGGPVNLLHVHGTSDTVVPMTGRQIREIYHQGDVRQGIAFWRHQDRCRATPSRAVRAGRLQCDVWEACGSGRQLQLCLHDGGHVIPQGWVDLAVGWAERVSGPAAR